MAVGVSEELASLGFDGHFAEKMSRLPAGLVPARVVGQHRRQWDVHTGDAIERATLAGRHYKGVSAARRDEAQPTVGDWVAIARPASDSDSNSAGRKGKPRRLQLPVIEEILERRTVLLRTSLARRGQSQALAANIDLVAVVTACVAPGGNDHSATRSLNPRRLERYLTGVRAGGAEPLVVLNKADLDPQAEERANELAERLGCRVVLTHTLSDEGLSTLQRELTSGTTIGLVGLSGVGKSSIVNGLLGEEVARVGAERQQDARGRHTTTHRELFVASGDILLIDTPGMREFALSNATEDDLDAFDDIVALAGDCRFRNCSHQREPGCAVRAAVASGRLSDDRVQNFCILAKELSDSARTRQRQRDPGERRPQRQQPTTGDWDD